MNNKQTSRSPLKDKPLRYPGQSLDEEIDKLVDDKMTTWVLASIYFVVIAAMEWFRWCTSAPYSPKLYTFLAVIVIGISYWKIKGHRKQLKRLRLGRDGERAVGQYLEELRQQGYKIYHDIQGEDFNIDHVAIGPTGIYTLETKTFSKPADRDSRISFDGETIKKDGITLDRDPIVQAKAQSRWLSRLLEESTGRKNRVRPVVLFPGWFVESSGWQKDLWVLEPKGLQAFMEKQDVCLTKDEIKLFSFHLSRFVRSI